MSAALFLYARAGDARPGDQVVVDGPEGRHAAGVVRLGVGEPVRLGDGRGVVLYGEVTRAGRAEVTVAVHERQDVAPSSPRITVIQALPKADRGELAVELMTELGVDEILPWSASRSVARWRDDRVEKGLAKWRSTAREAAKQSRRAYLPEIGPLTSTAAVVAGIAAADLAVVLHEQARAGLLETVAPRCDGLTSLVLVVGPEGGISDDELAAFTAAGAHAVRLGEPVLRTSTAGAAALAALAGPVGRWR